jgi:hypothetical protein
MANPDSIALAASAEADGLESVLVGGNAVNLHAYLRTTFDVHLLVRESESERWLSFFEQHGYIVFHQTRRFYPLAFRRRSGRSAPGGFDAGRRTDLLQNPRRKSPL